MFVHLQGSVNLVMSRESHKTVAWADRPGDSCAVRSAARSAHQAERAMVALTLLLAGLAVVAALYAGKLWTYVRAAWMLRAFPGPPPASLLAGHVPLLNRPDTPAHRVVKQLSEQYRGIFRLRLLWRQACAPRQTASGGGRGWRARAQLPGLVPNFLRTQQVLSLHWEGPPLLTVARQLLTPAVVCAAGHLHHRPVSAARGVCCGAGGLHREASHAAHPAQGEDNGAERV